MREKRKKPIANQRALVSQIKTTALLDEVIKFSFKYLDFTNPKFVITACERPYFETLLDRLKHISGLKESEVRYNNAPGLRSHSIKWQDTTEPNGFGLKGQLKDLEGWQFELSSNEHGRVHGFILKSTFYVVWFDPNHALYS